MGYGFDNATADWWVSKTVNVRRSDNHFDSKNYFFTDALDTNVRVASLVGTIDQFSLHQYSKLVINNIAALFEGDDLSFYFFRVWHGAEIIEFLYKHQKLPLKYLNDTCIQYSTTNMYYSFTNFTELVEWRPCLISFNQDELEAWCQQAIDANPKSVEDYRKGKTVAIKHLMGQVMKLSKGKAEGQTVIGILETKLKA
jgi:Asp-tRNA(Asn)/Glu-tRNA(Gln) amidotransferase B subunit